jgi:RND superfamily putative drug exporter
MFYQWGRRMARARYAVLASWCLVVFAAVPFAPRAAGALQSGGFFSDSMESSRAIAALQRGLRTNLTVVQIVFTSQTLSVNDARFVDEADHVVARLAGWSEVSALEPFTLDPSAVAFDRHAAYDTVFLRGDPDHGPGLVSALRTRLTPQPDLRVIVGGGPVFYEDIQSVSEADLRRAEEIAFPFALLALLVVFRSVVAAGLPAAVGGCSVIVSLAVLYWLARISPVSIFALNITTLFGLGLGVDYSLFMVSRFREELAAGREVADAIGVVMSTAGRAVFFSGLAVSIGLLGLVAFPLNMLHSVGLGGLFTVALAILAAATLLPALLGILGPRVNAFPVRLPGTVGRWWRARFHEREDTPGRAAPPATEGGFWHALATGVMRRPVTVFCSVLALLLLFGVPFLSVRLSAPDASILPPRVASRQAYDLLNQRFDAEVTTPTIIAVQTHGSPLTPANLTSLDRYVRRLEADPRVASVQSIVSLDPRLTLQQYEVLYADPGLIADPYLTQSLHTLAGQDITMVIVVSRFSLLDQRSEALVEAVRNSPPGDGLSILVDGPTAAVIDYVNSLYGVFPYAVLVVALVTYVVLLFLFRSVVLPLKAILMNTLSILASYGALVFIFQQGHFSRLLNFTPLGFVEASAPILMFCALFGLSMDYEVFLLSRVREAYEETGDNTRAVALGLERSGGIITSAAAIVILVSAAFASADMLLVKALGVGMALAVLLDATLVRGLLVPATMRLLGRINWWWPAQLRSLLPARTYAMPAAQLSMAHAGTAAEGAHGLGDVGPGDGRVGQMASLDGAAGATSTGAEAARSGGRDA